MKWTEIITVSELEELAKEYWVDKTCGGVEPKPKDMFIAGFVIGVKRSSQNAEAKLNFESRLIDDLKERNQNLQYKAKIEKELSDKLFEQIRGLEKDLEIFRALEHAVKDK